jgi:hypothetical protein
MRSLGTSRSEIPGSFAIVLIMYEAHGASTGCGDQRSSAAEMRWHQATWDTKSLVAKFVNVRQSFVLLIRTIIRPS